MKKKILIISQVIPQWYVDLLTSSLGDDCLIDIITGSEVKGNIIKSPEHDATSFKSRLISWYKHYRFMIKWLDKNKNKKYNLVFAVSNPPINSYIGLKIKRTFHAPFIYMNWDLYPQVIQVSIHNPVISVICKLWSRWNDRNYPKIDQLITIGDIMAESMIEDLTNDASVEVIPIGVDTGRLKPVDKKENPFCIENQLVDKFVVLYSGKMGLGHNIELILEASEKLKNNKDVVFVFIGFGPKYDTVKNYIEQHHTKNIMLFPLQSEDMFPYSMACGDIGIVSQEASMAHLFMPSKVYSMMACGETIVGIGTDHDDLSYMIKKDKIGAVISDGSSETLAREIQKLYSNPSLSEKYKRQSRRIAFEKYDIAVVKEKYQLLLSRYL